VDDKIAKVFVIVDLKLGNALKYSKIICSFYFINYSIPLQNPLKKMILDVYFGFQSLSVLV